MQVCKRSIIKYLGFLWLSYCSFLSKCATFTEYQSLHNLIYFEGNMIKKLLKSCLMVLLHKSMHLQGSHSLRPCSSRPYCTICFGNFVNYYATQLSSDITLDLSINNCRDRGKSVLISSCRVSKH